MIMEAKYNAFLPLSLSLFLLCSTRLADAQPGFLSIWCGNEGNYTDPDTNITWVPDDNFIHNIGEKEVDIDGKSLRVFRRPPDKPCYELPSLTPNLPHLLRLAFFLPNSSVESPGFNFNFSVETTDMLYMEKMVFCDGYSVGQSENILVSADSVLLICLIRTSEFDDPFISTIELRPLQPGMYDTAKTGIMLHTEERCDVGREDWVNDIIRYPQDPFDRLWDSDYGDNLLLTYKNTTSSNNSISNYKTKNFPPYKVMRTAVVSNNSDNMYFYLEESTSQKAVLLLYSAELDSTGERSFSVVINDLIQPKRIDLHGTFSALGEFEYNGTSGAIVRLQSNIHGRSPIINAYETYSIFQTELPTSSHDVKALVELKKALSNPISLKNWISDPCFGLPWDGIICSNISNTTILPRISQLDLSGKKLQGPIPQTFEQLTELVSLSLNDNDFYGKLPNLTNLFKLETLHLQNNHLSGKIPEWLSKLNNLTYLDISYNNFEGVIPLELLNKENLTFNFNGNKHLCRTKKKCSDHVTSIALGVAGGLILTAILLAILIYRFKLKCSPSQRSPFEFLMVNVENSSKSRSFTLEEMRTTTENFSHKIGQGSFGSVFLGKLQDGKEIAVKVLSVINKHGIDQFSNEVDLLSKINHKKLVSFIGYCICNESRDLMLVYEYMSAGSLSHNLYDPDAPKYSQLGWKNRLKIALDAAQGLEYLHISCTPKIIHRDVKSSNILIDGNLNGKLADFGLSRVTGIGETSQINTTIKGTPGYLDPMYYRTHILTDKSDVYSFGVVLLEVICGRKPIDFKVCAENVLLTEWVASYLGEDKDDANVQEIVDRRLGNLQLQSMKSTVHVANVAWRCIANEPSRRPTISEVVLGIKEAMAIEEECNEGPDEVSLTSTSGFPTSL